MRRFSAAIKDEVGDVDGLSGIQSLAVSPDGKHLYSVSHEQALDVFATSRAAAPTGPRPEEKPRPSLADIQKADKTPAYLPTAGNDYAFASGSHGNGITQPILVRLNARCAACHGGSGQVMTFNQHKVDPLQPVVLLKPTENEHARYVIGRKGARKDFTSLREQWGK